VSKKKKRREKKSPSPPTAQSKTEATDSSMSIDGILAQLSSLADNSRSFITGKQEDNEFDEIWKADIAALEQATAILSAIQDEGIREPEQVHDLIADYNAIADERREMHRKYEHPDPAISVGGQDFCPECRNPIRYQPRHCPRCGKRLNNEINPKRRKP
jgi:hypothetical protein